MKEMKEMDEKNEKENPMKKIRIEKVTLNIGCGDDAQKIEKAKKLLQMLTDRTPVVTKSKRRSTFKIPKGKPLGVMVTLRGQEAAEFLKRALESVESRLPKEHIDSSGNFSFGIKEYIDISGVKYSHDIGMMGLDVAVTLERPGFHVKKRRARKAKIGAKHKLNKEETINWVKETFKVDVIE